MIEERTITILGKEVRMRYCAAAETGYERLSGKKINIFTPTTVKWDDKGNVTEVEPSKATEEDYIYLGCAAIIAAYSRTHEEPVVSAEEILFDADPNDVIALMKAVMELRAKWYDVPEVIDEEKTKGDDQKNV